MLRGWSGPPQIHELHFLSKFWYLYGLATIKLHNELSKFWYLYGLATKKLHDELDNSFNIVYLLGI